MCAVNTYDQFAEQYEAHMSRADEKDLSREPYAVDTYFDSGTSRPYFIGVNHYHQTMGEYIQAFSKCGFLLRTLLEPDPGPDEPEERRAGWLQVPFIIVMEFVKSQS